MYSGGKDSNYAVKHALDKGWNIKYLLSVKPTRTDCYLFHFATVEHTKLQAEALGLKHYLISCTVADPNKEADIVSAVLNPDKCEPPSFVFMVLAKLKMFSKYPSLYCIATSS